ncbi:MAG: DsbA family protein [Bacteroidota bacterium]
MKKLVTLLIVMFVGAGIANQVAAQNGSEKQTITMTEYSDYQCPACAHFHPIVEKLKEKYGDQIELELKYFPLNSHQYAALAARAAEAAKNQDKFKEMHNLIFENQQRWSNSSSPTSIFVSYAEEIDLDIDQFKNDLNSAETQKTVMEQKQEGRSAGVNATPTFFIDGQKVDSLPRSFEEFDQLVQQHLN